MIGRYHDISWYHVIYGYSWVTNNIQQYDGNGTIWVEYFGGKILVGIFIYEYFGGKII